MINLDAKTAKEQTKVNIAVNENIINKIYTNDIIPAINNGHFETNATCLCLPDETNNIVSFFEIKGFKISNIKYYDDMTLLTFDINLK